MACRWCGIIPFAKETSAAFHARPDGDAEGEAAVV